MELKPFRVFMAVADRQGFAAAARDLDLAPASVTRIIAQLEEDLGVQLFVRTTRQVSLTSAGAMVLARIQPTVEKFDAASRELLQDVKQESGHLRLTAPVSLGVQLLPEVIAGFRAKYPRISVEINFTDTLLNVISSNCDLAIRVSGPPTDKSTIWQKLCEVPRRAVASPRLFENRLKPEHPKDLDTDQLMAYNPDGMSEQWEFSRPGVTHSVRAGKKIIANNGDYLFSLACRGEGIAVLPDFITDPGLRSGGIVQILPDWTLPTLWLTLFYPPYEKLPPLVGTFAQYFEEFILAHPDLYHWKQTV